MADNINDIDARVQERIQDASGKLSPPARHAHIRSALAEYQKVQPRWLVSALVGASTYDYAVSGLAGFEDGFSWIEKIEGPILLGPYSPPCLDRDRYAIVRTPSGQFLRFLNWAPSTAETYHVTVAGRHTLNGETSTVLSVDDEALADLAAAYCAEALEAFYTQGTDGSIQADTVDHSAKAETYRALKASFRKAYETKVAIPDRSPAHLWIARA